MLNNVPNVTRLVSRMGELRISEPCPSDSKAHAPNYDAFPPHVYHLSSEAIYNNTGILSVPAEWKRT